MVITHISLVQRIHPPLELVPRSGRGRGRTGKINEGRGGEKNKTELGQGGELAR